MATFLLVWTLASGDAYVLDEGLSWEDCSKLLAYSSQYSCVVEE